MTIEDKTKKCVWKVVANSANDLIEEQMEYCKDNCNGQNLNCKSYLKFPDWVEER